MGRNSVTKKTSYVGPQGFGGGLNTTDNPVIVPEHQVVIADNVLIGRSRSRKKRGGSEYYHTASYRGTASYPASGTAIRGHIEYWRYSAANEPVSDLFLHHGTKVWSVNSRTSPAIDRTGSLTLSSSAIPDYQVFDGILYFTSTNTADGYNKWDGTSASAAAAVDPADGPGKYICEHFGRMWMAGNTAFPFRLYYSSALDPEDWTGAAPSDGGSLDLIQDGDPDGIKGIFPFQSRLYVWTRRSLYEVTGNTAADFVVQVVSKGIGCISNASIVAVPNDLIFASDRGIHSLRQVASGKQTESTFLSRSVP